MSASNELLRLARFLSAQSAQLTKIEPHDMVNVNLLHQKLRFETKGTFGVKLAIQAHLVVEISNNTSFTIQNTTQLLRL